MKQIVFLSFVFFFSCNQADNSTQEEIRQLQLEISAIENTNNEFRNGINILKLEIPETYELNKGILTKIRRFKTELRDSKQIDANEIDSFLLMFKKFENHANFPKDYLQLLKDSKSYLNQYKYVMLIENYLFQTMFDEHRGSFVRFSAVQPFVFTNNERYKLNEEVKVRVGFIGFNKFNPYEVIVNNHKYSFTKIEDLSNAITITAEKQGENKIEGILKYKLSQEMVEIPIIIQFDVE